jgi:ATP-binding cassette subfamily B protein
MIVFGLQANYGVFQIPIVVKHGQQIDSWVILGYYKHLLALPQRFFDSMRIGKSSAA